MSGVLEAFALILLLSVAMGLVRIWRGPGFADRMLAAQLLGTTGVAILALLADPLGMPALHDVALVLALLAVLTVLAFVARLWDPDEQDGSPARDSDATTDRASDTPMGHARTKPQGTDDRSSPPGGVRR